MKRSIKPFKRLYSRTKVMTTKYSLERLSSISLLRTSTRRLSITFTSKEIRRRTSLKSLTLLNTYLKMVSTSILMPFQVSLTISKMMIKSKSKKATVKVKIWVLKRTLTSTSTILQRMKVETKKMNLKALENKTKTRRPTKSLTI